MFLSSAHPLQFFRYRVLLVVQVPLLLPLGLRPLFSAPMVLAVQVPRVPMALVVPVTVTPLRP